MLSTGMEEFAARAISLHAVLLERAVESAKVGQSNAALKFLLPAANLENVIKELHSFGVGLQEIDDDDWAALVSKSRLLQDLEPDPKKNSGNGQRAARHSHAKPEQLEKIKAAAEKVW